MKIWEFIAAWLYDSGIKSAGMASLRGTYEPAIPDCLKDNQE